MATELRWTAPKLIEVRSWRNAGMTYRAIGERLDPSVSTERVRQLCVKAERMMEKMRRKANLAKIKYNYDLRQACIATPTEPG